MVVLKRMRNMVRSKKSRAMKPFTREDFTKILRACHNIIRNNDKLSPEAAFDEISKILFIKIRYERDYKKEFTLNEFRGQERQFERDIRHELNGSSKDLSYMQFLFEKTKKSYEKDCLFEDAEVIRIRQNSFEQILEKLQECNLSDAKDDIKGIAFEEFLGKTFRGELGQFFTPRKIVDFMTHVLDPKEGEIVCDPACGSGGFLIKTFEYIRKQIEEDIKNAKVRLRKRFEDDSYTHMSAKDRKSVDKHIKKMLVALDAELDTTRPGSRMYNLSHNCIYGTDANPRMARTAKMNMIMHGDGHGGVHHHDGLLNVNGIFEERFDVILTNPPFGSRVDKWQRISEADRFTDKKAITHYKEIYGNAYDAALRQVNDHIGETLLSLYETGSLSGLTEVLFLERCLKLLKKGGRMGIVLPDGVLNTTSLQRVREYFEGRAKIIFICSIPEDVFVAAGATVKPSLVFLKRFTEDEEREFKYCLDRATKKSLKKFEHEVDKLNAELQSVSKGGKDNTRITREIRKRLGRLHREAECEAWSLVKEYFDYEIPMAKVDDAGITSIGTESKDNQLPALEEEYKAYRLVKNLWSEALLDISYELTPSGKIVRTMNGTMEVLNGGD